MFYIDSIIEDQAWRMKPLLDQIKRAFSRFHGVHVTLEERIEPKNHYAIVIMADKSYQNHIENRLSLPDMASLQWHDPVVY